MGRRFDLLARNLSSLLPGQKHTAHFRFPCLLNIPTVRASMTIEFHEEPPDSTAKFADSPPEHLTLDKACSPPHSGPKQKSVDGDSLQDLFVDSNAEALKGGGSTALGDVGRMYTSNQAASNVNAAMQDEDALACPVVESPHSSFGN